MNNVAIFYSYSSHNNNNWISISNMKNAWKNRNKNFKRENKNKNEKYQTSRSYLFQKILMNFCDYSVYKSEKDLHLFIEFSK